MTGVQTCALPICEARRVLGTYTKTTAADADKAPVATPPASSAIPKELMKVTPPVPKSGLDSALEFVHTLLKENPQTVQQLAAELGRGVGGWVGKSSGNARAGEVVGGMVGTALAAKLTAMSAPASPEAGGFQSLIYWLGGTAEPEGR